MSEMDLTERLRLLVPVVTEEQRHSAHEAMKLAADEIHRLRAESDRLREALAMLLFTYDGLDNEEPAPMTKAVFEARAALKETDHTASEIRCAECTCESGGRDCHWIKAGPSATDPQAMVAAAYEDAWRAAFRACKAQDSGYVDENSRLAQRIENELRLEVSKAIRALSPADARAALDRVIAEAEERGAKREREACAPVGYRVCAETRHVTLGDKVAAAIRARGESE